MRRYAERHVLPCALIVYNKIADDREADFDDEQYSIHYTVTSPAFRKRYFSAVQSAERFSSGSDIYQVHGNIGKIEHSEITVERRKGEAWRFETELFTNGYKIFQLLVRPLKQESSDLE